MTVINWSPVTGEAAFDMDVRRVLIAGFTGRNADAVQEHVDELAALGVPVPERIPAFYTVDPELLTTADEIEVDGSFTSGEVEPVVVVHDGRRWLTVGSDHTDRDLEAEGIELSKRACPKPIAMQLLPVDDIAAWDDVEITSWADGEEAAYQHGRLAQILPLQVIESELDAAGYQLEDGDVLFLGTVPVTGGHLRAADSFRAQLRDPATKNALRLAYRTHVRSSNQ